MGARVHETNVRLWANRTARMQKKQLAGVAAIPERTPPHFRSDRNCFVPVGRRRIRAYSFANRKIDQAFIATQFAGPRENWIAYRIHDGSAN
jgi:hypothetical protein